MKLTKICKISCLQVINILAFILLSTFKPVAAADPYDIISKKNLFRPDRTEWVIEKKDNKIAEKKVNPDKLELYGTIIVGDEKSALIYNKKAKVKGRRNRKAKQTKLYSPGDYIGGYIISAIDEGRVVLDFYGEKETLYLHEGKENPKINTLPSPVEKPKPKILKKQKTKMEKMASKMKAMLKSGKILEALAKSPFMSLENLKKMKKILKFNKEIMEEIKESGGDLDSEALKEKVEKFREQFMAKMEEMRE